ncbi:MAG: hypothetical protein V1855_00490, partial [bacterium]
MTKSLTSFIGTLNDLELTLENITFTPPPPELTSEYIDPFELETMSREKSQPLYPERPIQTEGKEKTSLFSGLWSGLKDNIQKKFQAFFSLESYKKTLWDTVDKNNRSGFKDLFEKDANAGLYTAAFSEIKEGLFLRACQKGSAQILHYLIYDKK